MKNIPPQKEAEFKKFVDSLCEKDEKTKVKTIYRVNKGTYWSKTLKQYQFSYDKKTECASLTFPDETSTIKIFSELMNSKFQVCFVFCPFISKSAELYECATFSLFSQTCCKPEVGSSKQLDLGVYN